MKNCIQKYRQENNITIKQIASRLSVSSSLVEAWEIGFEDPNLYQAIILCELFNITIDKLFDRDIETISFESLNDTQKENIYRIYDSFIKMNESED